MKVGKFIAPGCCLSKKAVLTRLRRDKGRINIGVTSEGELTGCDDNQLTRTTWGSMSGGGPRYCIVEVKDWKSKPLQPITDELLAKLEVCL